MREIIFDTETTGLNPAAGDRMVEIGCVEIFNRVETGRHFHAYFNPGRRHAVRGRSGARAEQRSSCRTSRLFGDKAEELLEFIADSPLVAHNAGFDFGFLNHELEPCGRPRCA